MLFTTTLIVYIFTKKSGRCLEQHGGGAASTILNSQKIERIKNEL